MTVGSAIGAPFGGELTAVHVGVPAHDARRMLEIAGSEGRLSHYVDCSGVGSRAELFAVLTEVFQFPTPTTSFDGALDWLSDLDWFGSGRGHVMVFDRLDVLHRQESQVFRALVRLFPDVVDRMRGGGEFCHIVITGTEPEFVAAVLRELDDANKELEAAAAGGYVRDTAPATIFDHSAPQLPST